MNNIFSLFVSYFAENIETLVETPIQLTQQKKPGSNDCNRRK
jgi:hypothetical protein